MPRYFFNVRDGYDVKDDLGTELPDVYAAQDQAIRTSGQLLYDMGAEFWNETHWQMEVTDQQGQILFTLTFSAQERIHLGPRPPRAGGA